MAGRKTYTEDQKTRLVELAQEVGIGRAIRELGYPSYPAALDWCKQRGVQPNVDQLMANMKKYHTFYEDTDARIIAEQALGRVQDKLMESDLDADELKKVTEALQKATNTWLLLQGKANSITETQKKDGVDVELMNLLNVERDKTSRDLEPRSSREN